MVFCEVNFEGYISKDEVYVVCLVIELASVILGQAFQERCDLFIRLEKRKSNAAKGIEFIAHKT